MVGDILPTDTMYEYSNTYNTKITLKVNFIGVTTIHSVVLF